MCVFGGSIWITTRSVSCLDVGAGSRLQNLRVSFSFTCFHLGALTLSHSYYSTFCWLAIVSIKYGFYEWVNLLLVFLKKNITPAKSVESGKC